MHLRGISLAVMLASAGIIHAQPYPAKSVRLIVPLVAGGPTDILARLIAYPLGERLGQQVIVDNRAGAGGNIGAEMVAKSPPDGYTLFMGTSGPISINVSLYPKIGYDPVRDFAPIILAASAPFVVVVHPALPVSNIKQLIALAKAKPSQLNYGQVPGAAAHLASELFKSTAGLNMVFVPYKGAAPANNDLVAGQIQLSFASTPGAMPLVKGGRLKALAISSAKRISKLPDLPTIAESGVPGYEASVWYGVVAPAKTSPDIIARLYKESASILQDRASREKMDANDFEATMLGPEQFGAFIRREIEKWGRVVKATGAKAE
ncbi:MAG TPA: tripartite tricarboxylate transporter substrate binding protein [Burkholderiales bacterium]|nr:tripartite tricarboxylate transporter substrate binding protein [Burkholderiales bacterium]